MPAFFRAEKESLREVNAQNGEFSKILKINHLLLYILVCFMLK